MSYRMPGEWEPHERTLMAWPIHPSWGRHLELARQTYAGLANTIVEFEPLTMLVHPGTEDSATRLLSDRIERVSIPYESAWQRDSAAIVVVDDRGNRRGIDFVFNAWGGRYPPWDQTAAAAGTVLEHLGIERVPSSLVLEGGAITVDGEGTLVTTEQNLLNPNRNPEWTREQIEAELGTKLGVRKVVWLPLGIAADFVTDGHVDAVCTFVRPGAVILQGSTDPQDLDFDRMAANREAIEAETDAAGRPFEIFELPNMPTELFDGTEIGVAYANVVLVNGAVIVATGGYPEDEQAIEVLGKAFPEHEIIAVGGAMLAYAGGGIHCTTMQIPLGGAM